MKKLLIVVLALSVAVAFSGMAFAQNPPAQAPAKAPAKTTTHHAKTPKVVHKSMKGAVVSTDQTANTIVVKGAGKKGAEMTFNVDPAAKITLKKKAAKLADLVAGTKVYVKYTVADSKNVASEIMGK